MKGRLFLITVLLACYFAACNNTRDKAGNSNGNVITIACLKGPSSMGIIKFTDSINTAGSQNIKIEILNEPIQVRKMMIEGNADFAFLPANMAAITYNKGLNYKLIAISGWGNLYLTGQDTVIKEWGDLRNKKVNVMAKGMVPDVVFRQLLEKNGIMPDKDITLDYSFPTHIDLANAVAAGQAELGVIAEPMVSMAMHRNKQLHTILDLNSEWNRLQGVPMAQTAFIGRTGTLQDEPQMTAQIISACKRSFLWVNNNPDSAAVLIVKYDILPDHEVAANSIPRSNINFVIARNIHTQILEFLDIFYKMNPDIIGGKIPDENFFY